MKKIEYQDTIYDIPQSIWELTLQQFIDVYLLLRDNTEMDLEVQTKLASILSGIPLETIDAMGWVTFEDLYEQITFEGLFKWPDVDKDKAGVNDLTKIPITFDHLDTTYTFNPDYFYTKMKDAMQLERIMKGKDLIEYLHYVLAICAHTEGEVFSLEGLDIKANAFLSLPMEKVYHPLFFYCNVGGTSSGLSRIYSIAGEPTKKMIQTTLAKVALGVRQGNYQPSMIDGDGN